MAIRRFEAREHTFRCNGVWLKEIAHNQVRILTKISKISEFGHPCSRPFLLFVGQEEKGSRRKNISITRADGPQPAS